MSFPRFDSRIDPDDGDQAGAGPTFGPRFAHTRSWTSLWASKFHREFESSRRIVRSSDHMRTCSFVPRRRLPPAFRIFASLRAVAGGIPTASNCEGVAVGRTLEKPQGRS